jgi:hypothetical protein
MSLATSVFCERALKASTSFGARAGVLNADSFGTGSPRLSVALSFTRCTPREDAALAPAPPDLRADFARPPAPLVVLRFAAPLADLDADFLPVVRFDFVAIVECSLERDAVAELVGQA